MLKPRLWRVREDPWRAPFSSQHAAPLIIGGSISTLQTEGMADARSIWTHENTSTLVALISENVLMTWWCF